MGRCTESDRDRIVVVDPQVIERIADTSRSLWAEDPEADREGTADSQEAREREARRAEAIGMLSLVIETRLTTRQRQVVELYFYGGKTQAEIAEQLGISQQVVSKQLFGVMRKGRRVGGAIRKLKHLLESNGIRFE